MWYRFEKGNPVGIPRIKYYQVVCYDMNNDGNCFDEMFFKPDEINLAITKVETIEDKHNFDRFRVFAVFDNDDMYELKLEKIDKEHQKHLSNFYGKHSEVDKNV